MPPWTKLPGLAEHLGLSQKTTRKLVKDGIIPCVELPTGTKLFNLDDADDSLRSLANKKTDQILREVLR